MSLLLMSMMFNATKKGVKNRGVPPDKFLQEMIEWFRKAPDEIFTPNQVPDIYDKVEDELGPYPDILTRKAVMFEVMRVLAGFESSWDWKEGVDTSRLGATTPANAEAGAWQTSWDSRSTAPGLDTLLFVNKISTGTAFQQAMKFNHELAMEYVARLMRKNTKHNGPLYKGDERLAIRKSLRGAEESIYPWLSRSSVNEIKTFLS